MAKIVALLCQALFPPSKRVNGEAGGTMPGTEPSLAERWVRIEDEKVEFGFGQNRSKSKSSSRRRLSRPFRFVPDRLLSRRSARSQTKNGSIVMTRADDATDDGRISQPRSSSPSGSRSDDTGATTGPLSIFARLIESDPVVVAVVLMILPMTPLWQSISS